MGSSLNDRLGGFSFIRELVSNFYSKVLEEDDLIPFFAQTDMARLVDQTKLWATALEGPASYTTDQLTAIHRSM